MTVEEWALRSYGYSKKSQPDRIANEGEELRELAFRVLQAVFQVAARINWTYFGATSGAVASTSGGWLIPTAAELIGWMSTDGSTDPSSRVFPVGIGEVDPEPGRATVYRLGPRFFPGVNITTAASIHFLYSRTPTEPPDTTTAIETDYPVSHEDLLILEMAMYLALKDGRHAEMRELEPMRDVAALRFAQHLQHAAVGIPRTWFPQRFQGEEFSPLLRVASTGEE